jgi:hypothetical protein
VTEAPEVTDTAKTEEARFTQADIDRILKERLDREKANTAKAAEKAAAEAKAKALAEQGKHEERANLAESKLAEYEAYKAQVEEANAALASILETELANPNMPESTKELLAEMTPAKQLAHIAKYKAGWNRAAGPPNINGGGDGRKQGTTEDQRAQIARTYGIKPEFIK